MDSKTWPTAESVALRTGQADSQKMADDFRLGKPSAADAVRARVRTLIHFKGFGIPEPDRRDIEQEVLTQVWKSVTGSEFDADQGFWGFVSVVAIRRCIDWRRNHKQEIPLDPLALDPRPGALQEILAQERVDLAQAVVARLDEPCIELARLRITQGKSFDEIALILGRKPGTLRVQFHRCIQKAQAELKRRNFKIIRQDRG